MKLLIISAGILITASLCGCSKPEPQNVARHGRYVGIGIYSPEKQWTKLIGADAANVTPAARTNDDQAIIVVEDSDTGEVRACGDLTGYCVGMNPWKKGLTSAQTAPISLSEHVTPPKLVSPNQTAK